MGQLYNYSCDSCDYRTTISGGLDGGKISKTQTFECQDCKKLMDLPIELFQRTNEIFESTKEIRILFNKDLIQKLKDIEHIKLKSLNEKELLDLEETLGIKLRKNKWIEKEITQCPRCTSSSIIIWDNVKKKCPRCPGTMRRGQIPVLHWD